MTLQLTETEVRVLGALIEKDITTPEYYPLSLNALVNACNQKSNRDPVMQLDENAVRDALSSLQEKRLAGPAGGADSRVTKYEHRTQEVFNFTRAEVAVMCVLLLRGPQTPGELRGRTERTKESRWVHLLAGDVLVPEAPPSSAGASYSTGDGDRMARLEEDVRNLRAEVGELKDQLERFRKQFD